MKILRAVYCVRHIRRRKKTQHTRRRRIDHAGNIARQRRARPRKIRRRGIEKRNSNIAKISRGFIARRHRSKTIHRIFVSRSADIQKNKCFVAPIIKMRNAQRPANISAKTFLEKRFLRWIYLRQRIWPRIKRRIFKFIEHAEVIRIYSLPHHPLQSPRRSVRIISAASLAPSPPCTAGARAATASPTPWPAPAATWAHEDHARCAAAAVGSLPRLRAACSV